MLPRWRHFRPCWICREWSRIMLILLWSQVVADHDESESGFIPCHKYFVIPTMRRIRATRTATSDIFKGYKSDDDESQIQIQFQFQIIFRSHLFSISISSQRRWQQRQHSRGGSKASVWWFCSRSVPRTQQTIHRSVTVLGGSEGIYLPTNG